MARKRLTDLEKEGMRQARKDGQTLRAVAEEYGASIETVRKYTTPFVPDRLGSGAQTMFDIAERLYRLAWDLHPEDEVVLKGCGKGHSFTVGHDMGSEPCGVCGDPTITFASARGFPGTRLND